MPVNMFCLSLTNAMVQNNFTRIRNIVFKPQCRKPDLDWTSPKSIIERLPSLTVSVLNFGARGHGFKSRSGHMTARSLVDL